MTLRRSIALSLLLAPLGATTQSVPIPIRQLSRPTAVTGPIAFAGGIRQLNDGRLLVNDPLRGRLVLFDAALKSATVLVDADGMSGNIYPKAAPNRLYEYLGDSTLLGDGDSHTLLVIAPSGRVAHVMAAASRTTPMSHNTFGWAGFDARGRLIHQGTQTLRIGGAATAGRELPYDTIPIVRADFDARTVDTIEHILNPRPPTVIGGSVYLNPVRKAADEFVVLSDGSLAIIRAHDYHIDWVYADGTRASTPKMPFDWRRLTDADKQAKVDSAQHIIDSLRSIGQPYMARIARRCVGSDSARIGQTCTGPVDTLIPKVIFAPLSEMPDYVPPIRPHAAIPDRDANLWILPTTSLAAKGGLLYDVVNRRGELVERVQLSKDRVIAGFGRGGIVYLLAGTIQTGFVLERTTVVR